MSMLTRKGTVVRIKRGSLRGSRRSHRSVKSISSCTSDSLRMKYTENDCSFELNESVGYKEESKIRPLTDVILSFDNERQLMGTSVDWDNQMSTETQPDYGAFMYEVREADKDSESIIEFCCKTSNIICNSLLVTVLTGHSIAIPVTMVSIGIKYLDSCPKEPRIPIYLLVGGCFGLIKLFSTLWKNIQIRRQEDMDVVFDDRESDVALSNKSYRTLDTLLFLFLFSWHIVGSYWTLIIWTPPFKQILHEPSNWCDKTVYMFTFFQLCGSYCVMIVYVLVLCIIVCTQRCCYT